MNIATITHEQQSAMIHRNYDNLTTTLALLVPWSPFSISTRIDLQSYHSRFNLTSSRVLSQRFHVFAANLADWDHHHGDTLGAHELDAQFDLVQNVVDAATKHLLDVPFSAMDPELASGGNREQWETGKLIAAGGSNLELSGIALRPFFF